VKFFLHYNGDIAFFDIAWIEKETYSDPRVSAMLDELSGWPCREITNHKNATHPLHTLSFIAELGMNRHYTGIERILQKITKNQSEEGSFEALINIPVRYGGRGGAAD
jgi:hypothetical protein